MSNAAITVSTNHNTISVVAEYVDRCEGRVLRYHTSILSHDNRLIANSEGLSDVVAQELIEAATDETHHTARRIVEMATKAAEFTDSLCSSHDLSEFTIA